MKLSFLSGAPYRGPAPGFDVWPAPSHFCDPKVAAQSMRTAIDLCQRAENLGFDWISIAEHHYAPYMLTPNPMVLAGALSQVIRRAKIALLGPLVPLNNPIRLAEEVAMLDCITNGRMVVMFLRGTVNEHNTYNTPKDDTRGMTQEGIDLIIKAWSETEPFSWHGKHYNYDTVSIWPRPVQSPYPQLFGSGNSDESVAYCAQRRMGIGFSFAPVDVVERWVGLYRKECAKAGWEPTPEHIVYRGIAYAASSDDQAKNDAAAYFGAKQEEESQLRSATMGGPQMMPLIVEPYFVGGRNTLLERFDGLRRAGVGVTDLYFSVGSIEQQIASTELFAREVMPELKSWQVAA